MAANMEEWAVKEEGRRQGGRREGLLTGMPLLLVKAFDRHSVSSECHLGGGGMRQAGKEDSSCASQ